MAGRVWPFAVGQSVPFALHDRLGAVGSEALAGALVNARDEAVVVATERFEHRLTDECGKLRAELQSLAAGLRAEMQLLRSELKADIAERHTELIKWTFLFWVGQLAVVVAALRLFR